MSTTVRQRVYTSPFAAPDVPDTDLVSYLMPHAERLAGKEAFVDASSGRALTYGALARGVRQVAAGLAERGFRKGDVLAIHLPNVPEYPLALSAAASLGGIVTTPNPLYTSRELAYQLEDSGARYMLTLPGLLEHAAPAAAEAGVEEVFVLGEAPGATPFAELLGSSSEPPSVEIDADDPVLLLYSSGTTGLPKGVVLTHRNVVTNIVQGSFIFRLREQDRSIAVAPFSHSMGLMTLSLGLVSGGTTVCMPRFDLEGFLGAIQEHQVTWALVAPPIVQALAAHPVVDRYDLSSVRFLACGAAPLAPEAELACARRLGCLVAQGLGMTEATGVIAASSVSDAEQNLAGSCGWLVPGAEARIVDPVTGRDAGTGELWLRGPQVMPGYLNRPAETAETIDADGWLHTGDVARFDKRGRLFVLDRIKELIKYKGLQVAPAELEGVLVSHPAVADAAVVGAPDHDAGEVPVAFVALRGETGADDLIAYVSERVAPHKRIRRLEFVESVPRSPTGKVLRRELRDRVSGDRAPARTS